MRSACIPPHKVPTSHHVLDILIATTRAGDIGLDSALKVIATGGSFPSGVTLKLVPTFGSGKPLVERQQCQVFQYGMDYVVVVAAFRILRGHLLKAFMLVPVG